MDGFRPLTLIQAGEVGVFKQLQSELAQNWPRLVSAGESHCKTSLQGVRRSSKEVKLLSHVRLSAIPQICSLPGSSKGEAVAETKPRPTRKAGDKTRVPVSTPRKTHMSKI